MRRRAKASPALFSEEVGELGAVGRISEHDKLVIEDGGSVYPVMRAAFESEYELDPNWKGGPPT